MPIPNPNDGEASRQSASRKAAAFDHTSYRPSLAFHVAPNYFASTCARVLHPEDHMVVKCGGCPSGSRFQSREILSLSGLMKQVSSNQVYEQF